MIGRPELGDRFAAATEAGPDWIGVDELFGANLRAAIEAHAQRRGTRDLVSSASLLFQRWVSVLTGPLLTAAWLDDRVHLPPTDGVRVRLAEGTVVEIAFTGPYDVVGLDAGSAAALAAHTYALLEGPVAAVRAQCRVGTRTLWGNAAASIAAAFRRMSWEQEDPTAFRDDAVAFLQADPRVARLVDVFALTAVGRTWHAHERRTCCFAYKTNGGDCCASCSLLTPKDRRARLTRHAAEFIRVT